MGELLSGGCVLASNSRGNAKTCPERLPLQTSGKGASSDNGQGAMPHARRRDRDVCGMEEGSRKCLTRVAATDARGGGRRRQTHRLLKDSRQAPCLFVASS